MERKIIVKVLEKENNFKFLSKLLKFITDNNKPFKILRRPQTSQSLISFDGFVEISCQECSLLIEEVKRIAEITDASIKVLYFSSLENVKIIAYDEGHLFESTSDYVKGRLDEGILCYGQTLSIHFGENRSFLTSEDFLSVMTLIDKYEFISYDFNDHVMTLNEKFYLDTNRKSYFFEDLKMIIATMNTYNIVVDCQLVGYDVDFNVEKIVIDSGNIERYSIS